MPSTNKALFELERNFYFVKSLKSISYYTIYPLLLELTGINKRLYLNWALLHKEAHTIIF